MSELTVLETPSLISVGQAPSLVSASGPRAKRRFCEFFAANIRNPNTRTAYARAAADFCAFAEAGGLAELRAVQPIHVAAWVEELTRSHALATVKQRLAGVRMLFDWLVVGQIVPANPACSVPGELGHPVLEFSAA